MTAPKYTRLALVSLALAALLGCSGGTSPTTTSSVSTTSSGSGTTPAAPSATASLPGGWEMEIENNNGTSNQLVADLEGALSVKDSLVSGVFRLTYTGAAMSCGPSTQDIPFTGSVDTNNLLTLTSGPVSGGVITFQVQLPLRNNLGQGTAQIVGGTCALPSTMLTAVFVPDQTGTYTGTLTPQQLLGQPPVSSNPVTMVVSESGPDADGRFPTSIALTYVAPASSTSAACTLSGTYTGSISGLSATFYMPMPDINGISPELFFTPIFSATSQLLHLSVPGGISGCQAGLYTGQLTKQ